MQIGEWAASVACWVTLACILFAKMMAWEGIRGQKGLTAVLRTSGIMGVIAGCVTMVAITALRKPDNEPWSNLQKWPIFPRYGAIHINPSVVKFHKSNVPNTTETYVFTITNVSEKDVYTVATTFRIDYDASHNFYYLAMPTEGAKTPSSAWRCFDTENRPLFLLVFNQIAAHDSHSLTISRENSIGDAQLSAKVNYLRYDPVSFSGLENSNTVGMTVQSGEKLSCETWAIFVPSLKIPQRVP
jgi:hypothetical protein